MFENARYMTKGVDADIPLWLQNLMWYAIDIMKTERKDYLQVFKLTAVNGIQKIVHIQEQPPYSHEYLLAAEIPITKKVFVIDDGDHSTMLLADEY